MEIILENPDRKVLIANIRTVLDGGRVKLGSVSKRWHSIEEIKEFAETHGVFIHPFGNVDWPSPARIEIIVFPYDSQDSFERYYLDMIRLKSINVFITKYKERYTTDKQPQLLLIEEELKQKYPLL